MALTANREVDRLVDGPTESIRTYAVAASTHIYKGSLVGLDSDGYLRPMAAAATTAEFIGLSYEEIDNSSGSDGDLDCRVFTQGDFIFSLASVAVTDITAAVYANGANDVPTLTSTSNTQIGNVVGVPQSNEIVLRIKQTAA